MKIFVYFQPDFLADIPMIVYFVIRKTYPRQITRVKAVSFKSTKHVDVSRDDVGYVRQIKELGRFLEGLN